VLQRVVLFRKKAGVDGKDFDQKILALEPLEGQIDEIQSWTVSVTNVAGTEWDGILIGDFRNAEEMQRYADHPAHVEVANAIGGVADFALFDREY
jgi:muramoyltetrapeptide carboxypeptidase LdcA involved in peptidoglycan recycling